MSASTWINWTYESGGAHTDATKGFLAASLLLLQMGILLACDTARAADAWAAFLQHPDPESSRVLLSTLEASKCGWGKDENNRVFPPHVRQPLFRLVSNGNEQAFVVGLSVKRCLDGGDLEDFYGSAGLFMEHHPQRFLAIVTELAVMPNDVASMAADVDINDDIDAALRTVSKRRVLLQGVTDEEVVKVRSEAIRALDALEQDLKQAKESLRGEQ